MKECLVDVLNGRDTVLHVVPVSVEGREGAVDEGKCVQEALTTATHLHLVPDEEVDGLHARVHVGRGGPLTPVGDVLKLRQDAQQRAEERVRLRAYFLWQTDGCSGGRADEHWHQACEIEGQSLAG